MTEATPDNLIGDRAYDSDKLDEELREDDIEMIASHRKSRKKPKTLLLRTSGYIIARYQEKNNTATL